MLTPKTGGGVGFCAALLMLLFLSIVQPLSKLPVRDLLVHIGTVAMPRGAVVDDRWLLLLGGVYHAMVGTELGVLHAVSQRRTAVRGLIAVGVFYGVGIWVAGGLIVSRLVGHGLEGTVHSLPWFLACLLYGVTLGGYAAWTVRHRPPAPAVTMLKD